MVKKGFLKRIVAVPNVNPLDIRTDSNHDFLVLDKEKVYLGRSSKECDLVFREKIISRKHVVFHWSDSHWNIECLNDKNGVFVNGQLLNKNEVKKLQDNYIVSFGPNFLTDYLYQFTTKESSDRPLMSGLDLAKVNREVSLAKPKTAIVAPTSLVSAKPSGSLEIKQTDLDQLRANEKKMKQLNGRIQYLEEKVKRYRVQRRESRQRFRKCNNKLKLLQNSNFKQKIQLKNAKLSLARERLRKKELQKRLADQEKAQLLQSIKKEAKVVCQSEPVMTLSDSVGSGKIVRKYNEMFSEDFVCGICLELFIEPVTLTCGHTTCKFCINEWFKRNQNKRECPLCRTGIRMSWYKNVLIENVIEKYLATAEQDVLSTRNRLIEERAKVVEKSKDEAAANPPEHRHRHVFRLDGEMMAANPLLELFSGSDRINYHDLSFSRISEEGSSDEDEEGLNEEYSFDEFDEEFSEDEDGHEAIEILEGQDE